METLRGLGWEKEVVFVLNHRGHIIIWIPAFAGMTEKSRVEAE